MTFIQSIKTCFKKYAVFKGRAARSEFWWFQLFFLLSAVGVLTLAAFMSGFIEGFRGIEPSDNSLDAVLAIELVLLIPSLSVTARRLHDIGLSGWIQAPVLLAYLEDFGLVFSGLNDVQLVGYLTNAGLFFFVIKIYIQIII